VSADAGKVGAVLHGLDRDAGLGEAAKHHVRIVAATAHTLRTRK
jgi:hypothetical protein